jgi:hypothetical protein
MTKPNTDDTNLDEQDSGEVEQQHAEDETSETQDDSTSETDDGGDGGEDREFTIDDWDPEKRRFTQFKAMAPADYLKKVEDAYGHSYNEYKKVKDQLDNLKAEKLSEVAAGTADDKKDDTKTGDAPSMTDLWVSQEMKRKHVEQYNKFAEAHPEVNDDDELFEKLDSETGKYMNFVYSTEKRVPDLAEALDFAAYKLNLTRTSKEDKVLAAAKNAGAGSKSTSASKDPARPQFSDKQIEAARKIDASLRDKSRAEIEEILAKYK